MVSSSKCCSPILGSTINLKSTHTTRNYEASVGIEGELLAVSIPVKQLKLIQAWLILHEDELYACWNKAVQNIPFGKIEPLR